jgi:hypothetical protein
VGDILFPNFGKFDLQLRTDFVAFPLSLKSPLKITDMNFTSSGDMTMNTTSGKDMTMIHRSGRDKTMNSMSGRYTV